MSYTCLIIDDEQLARKLLQEFVSKIPSLELKGMCKNPLEALEIMHTETIDILLLDIQMPELTGVEFLKTIKNRPATIFTTAYSEFALEGYQLDVIDYLVKPFSLDRFILAINKAMEFIDLKRKASETSSVIRNETEHLLLHADHKIYKVKLTDIMYIEGLKEYVSYYTREKRIIVLQSLKSIEESLPPDRFIRVHRSYIVPIDRIKSLDGNQVQIGDKLIPIGRSYKEDVLKRVFSV
jgi:DNA-binding LytR/AlgR family response regulator